MVSLKLEVVNRRKRRVLELKFHAAIVDVAAMISNAVVNVFCWTRSRLIAGDKVARGVECLQRAILGIELRAGEELYARLRAGKPNDQRNNSSGRSARPGYRTARPTALASQFEGAHNGERQLRGDGQFCLPQQRVADVFIIAAIVAREGWHGALNE